MTNSMDNGFLMLLDRQRAKELFGCREDQPRLEWLAQLQADGATPQVDCRGQWQALHDAFSAVEIEDSVLSQCILGGRPLHQGDDYHVCLVRPDVVRAVAHQCGSLDTSTWGELADIASQATELFQSCAEIGGATVFVAKK